MKLTYLSNILLCPGCGAGLAARRGLRMHLLTHGYDWAGTYPIAAVVGRTRRLLAWQCKSCPRVFDTVQGFCHHGRTTGHGGFPLVPVVPIRRKLWRSDSYTVPRDATELTVPSLDVST